MTDLSQLNFYQMKILQSDAYLFYLKKNMNNFAVTEVRLVCITNDFLCMGNKKTHTNNRY